jgi:hypothetical protein
MIRTNMLNPTLSKRVFINLMVGTNKQVVGYLFIFKQIIVKEKNYIQFFIRTKCLI